MAFLIMSLVLFFTAYIRVYNSSIFHILKIVEVLKRMAKTDTLTISQDQLVQAWAKAMPAVLNGSDRVDVKADGADSKAIWVHIETAGHSLYSFDFKCTYMDSREVNVTFVDVEQDGLHINERTEVVQTLIEDYVRHIHECAQQLHAVTHD
jgi:hypothetical protein